VELRPDGSKVGRARKFYWNPMSFLGDDVSLDDATVAAHRIRATVRSCTVSLARQHECILVRASGGLDSTVVLSSLGDEEPTPKVTCVTYFFNESRADERPWARKASRLINCEHVEYSRNPRESFESVLRINPTAEPEYIFAQFKTGEIERELASERGISAVFTGDGGDSMFGSDSRPYVLDDYIRRGRLRGLLSLASDVALDQGKTVAKVLKAAIGRQLFGKPLYDRSFLLTAGRRLVANDLRQRALREEPAVHPWVLEYGHWRPSVSARLGALALSPVFYDLFETPSEFNPAIVSPLYSQPVVELCLRIPNYLHFEGGLDRGLMRRSFRGDVPDELLYRVWKDRSPGYISSAVDANRGFVAETLGSGALVKQGLLDRSAVLNAVAPSAEKKITFPGEILDHLSIEMWVQKWSA
jgi:asparagine synthase (glutamine-hydrolysing)